MNHSDLVSKIAESTKLSQKDVSAVLASLADEVAAGVAKGDKVTVAGLFIAESGERAERTGRNPRTGESMVIPAGKVVKLKAATALKRAVSE